MKSSRSHSASKHSSRKSAKSAKSTKSAVPISELKKQRANDLLAQHSSKLQQAFDTEEAISQKQKIAQLFKQQISQTKSKELQQQLQEAQREFQLAQDRKATLLAVTSKFITAAEQQRKLAVNAHSQTVYELQQTMKERFSQFQEDAEDQICKLKAQFDSEKDALVQVFNVRKNTLLQMRNAVQYDQDQQIEELRQRYAVEQQNQSNYAQEQLNICKLNLEEQNTELERHLLESHQEYKNQTDTKQHQFKILLLKDQQSSFEIDKQKARIARLQKQIVHWKAKIQSTSEEFKQKNQLLQKEKEECYKEFSQLKQKLNNYRSDEEKRAKLLVSSAHDAEDKIQSLKEQADRIVRISELCGRLETEAERVNEIDRLDVEQQREIDREAQEQAARHEGLRQAVRPGEVDPNQQIDAEAEIVEAVKELQHVNKKVSNATIDRLALQREQTLLERENKELREALQRYLSLGIMAQNAM